MYPYRFRLRVILLSLGVLFGYGGAVAHFAWHRHHGAHAMHDCTDYPHWFDAGSWESAPEPARSGAATPKPVQ